MTAQLVADIPRFPVPCVFVGEAHSHYPAPANPNVLGILCVHAGTAVDASRGRRIHRIASP